MKVCIWCRTTEKESTFNEEEHTVPKSLGDHYLCENVCDTCNSYFGDPQPRLPSIDTCLKEAMAISKFRLLQASKDSTIVYGREVRPRYQANKYKSQYFHVDFEKRKYTLKPAYKLTSGFQTIITRQFKRGLYKVFLEETERQRGNALDPRYDFIRTYVRHDLDPINEPPVIHFERRPGMHVYTDESLLNPSIYMTAEKSSSFFREEDGFFEFEFMYHIFSIATSQAWKLTFDNYIKKSLADKFRLIKGYRLVREFDDLDVMLHRALD